MKRISPLFVCILISLALFGCANSKLEGQTKEVETSIVTETALQTTDSSSHIEKSTTSSNAETTTTSTAIVETETESVVFTEEAQSTNAISDLDGMEVETEKDSVFITIPPEMVSEDDDVSMYLSVTKNEDGSVTYEMTKEQHEEQLRLIKETFNEQIKQHADEETYITSIEYNDDYSVFTVNVTTEDEFNENWGSLTTFKLSMFSGFYQMYACYDESSVVIHYIDSSGTEFLTYP